MLLKRRVAPLFKGVMGFYVEILRAANSAALRMTNLFGNRAKQASAFRHELKKSRFLAQNRRSE
jgi:hypothetical protein